MAKHQGASKSAMVIRNEAGKGIDMISAKHIARALKKGENIFELLETFSNIIKIKDSFNDGNEIEDVSATYQNKLNNFTFTVNRCKKNIISFYHY
ncbi:hypothetical protein ACM26V_14975 [Salipaludibacillus sp. HK11]|uniref:hypothetical protein n=1 Tax=Salipaludibacillus sp. HK11 TaxID=3394320 RepID=UPI0039FC733D